MGHSLWARSKAGDSFVIEREDLYRLPGMLTRDEVDFLCRLGQVNRCDGVILEIGSWKGKSTIALARGAAVAHGEKIFAVDPHKPLLEEGYTEDTEAEFLDNIQKAGVGDRVVPMTMTSQDAARGWDKPIRLLWIDGDHRYEPTKLDFKLWEPHLVEGGILAMHDTIRKKGPKRVLWEKVFLSGRFQEIAIVDNITAMRKVKRVSLARWIGIYLTLALRAVYIAARKSSVPHSKKLGRILLRRFTAQTWLPAILFVFSASIAR